MLKMFSNNKLKLNPTHNKINKKLVRAKKIYKKKNKKESRNLEKTGYNGVPRS